MTRELTRKVYAKLIYSPKISIQSSGNRQYMGLVYRLFECSHESEKNDEVETSSYTLQSTLTY